MNLSRLLRQSLRMTVRDWRAGELRLLAMALVIAVAAVTSVGFFVDRIRLGLERDAAQLLAADLVLSSDQPITDALRTRVDKGLLECDFGAWTGGELKELMKLPEWATVQRAPSTFTFPGDGDGDVLP